MSVKKIINSPDTCVDECLFGVCAAHPQLVLHARERVILDGSSKGKRRVAIISGGGAGHEPFAAGYVGPGMLTAAVSGSVFASPPSNHINHAIRSAAADYDGVFVVIPNYTGDILNFGLSVEIAKSEGIQVDSIVFGDDIALESHGIKTRAGRRGMCGIVAMFKVLGYLSATGASLTNIKQVAAHVLNNLASFGACTAACSLPGAGPLFHLAEDEMELGVGVHGEAGIQRTKLQTAEQLIATFLKHLIKYLHISAGDEVAVLVNNLGAMTNIEQWLIAGEVSNQLSAQKIKVQRVYAGPIFTSLNMAGVQVSLLKLTPEHKDLFLSALDFPTESPGWPGRTLSIPDETTRNRVYEEVAEKAETLRGPDLNSRQIKQLKTCLIKATTAIADQEVRLNELDSGCGDGDCGTTLRHLAQEIQRRSDSDILTFARPASLAGQLATVAQTQMGGTSGAIYSLFFTAIANELEGYKDLTQPAAWAKLWRAGINGVQKYSVARMGDRTMFDSLEPACEAFEAHVKVNPAAGRDALRMAIAAADKGYKSTKTMKALAGRASYVEESQLKDVDAGAYAVFLWLSAVLEAFLQQ